jgi:diaminohydroxyphosphoribosylaminopyrimidine deaminase/5-amino-6-(5-phosphoribosylamino)uracil reductase
MTASEFDREMMRRAIRLAMNGRGSVEPNPMVGCVIVKDGRIIGEGYHAKFGGPHAEPNALASCKEDPRGATAYVTLEPCCHTNKKTPPCAPRLIEAKIGRVVVGSLDPNPMVDGKGLEQLRAAEIEVAGPVMEPEAKQLIAAFLAGTKHRRPYVTLKWAQTADGYVAGAGKLGLVHGKRLQISNAASTRLVHQLRARCDGILVGSNTIQADDPLLTARGVEDARPLLRVGLASRKGLFLNRQLQGSRSKGPILLYCTQRVLNADAHTTRKVIERMNVPVQTVESTAEGLIDLIAVLADLRARNVTQLLVEPGPTLASSFVHDDLADRIWVFRSPRSLEQPGRAAASIPSHFIKTGELDVDADVLIEYLNSNSPVFFAAEPSADFVLAAEGP